MDSTATTISVEDNILKWTSSESQGQIELDQIICIVSKSTPNQGHRILFLRKDENQHDDMHLSHLDLNINTPPPQPLTPFLATIPPHLKTTLQIIISTRSGTGIAQSIFDHILRPFLNGLGLTYTTHKTTSATSIISLSETFLSAEAEQSQTIILLSGDGGLIDILDVFYKAAAAGKNVPPPPNIALIPCGTGNALANSIGLRDGSASAINLKTLLFGNPVPLPVFRTSFSAGSMLVTDEGGGRVNINSGAAGDAGAAMYGAVVASWGLHAALVADSDTTAYRKFGSERFKMAAQELLWPADGSGSHLFRGRITLTTAARSWQVPEDEHTYVLATLVPRLERDFVISPGSEALGGKMHFLRVGGKGADEVMRLMGLAYQGGGHVGEEGVLYEEVERVRIEFYEDVERWRRVCVDGKIVAVGKDGWMEICLEGRRLLNVIKP
ncbi:ATP-NAD kinase PpnK-type [Penicillium manginii]|uniref:ATP-NAD kinase PpnK-type n=1 Tax=Penicillium manginii TaxID=203109 RepID=UPI00254805FA|nr:ATP-NAD kinase PpnK-type [Penicillium manginii]KAJ5767890.1 ATP-NAD kinase PpnK-type [Penicillium manginii]